MKKINYVEASINILLIISFMYITGILTIGDYIYVKYIFWLNTIVSGLVSSFLLFKYHLVTKVIKEKAVISKKMDYILSFILGILSTRVLINVFFHTTSYIQNMLREISSYFNIKFHILWRFGCFIIFVLSIIGITFIYLALIKFVLPKIILFFKNLDKVEKRFLIFSSIIFCIVALSIHLQTNAFTTPIMRDQGSIKIFDVLYTTDAGIQITTRGFENINAEENDIRQPLFGLFAFPFGLTANIISEAFNILPTNFVYSYVIVCLQGFILSICAILLVRMLNKKSDIFGLLFFSSMYTTIFFGLNVEQYVFGVFWLILLFYNFVRTKKLNVILCSSAIGSLITNAIVIPFMSSKKSVGEYMNDIVNSLLFFAVEIIIFGQTWNIINGILTFGRFNDFMGITVTFKDKILQYLSFISNCFIAPRGIIDSIKYSHISYQLAPVINISIIGVLLLISMVVSFVINHKKTIIKIAFGWLIFSFVILVVIGWGTVENALIIYGLYFSWAYFILIYSLVDKIIQKLFKKWKTVIWLIIIIILLALNIIELIRIIEFGKTYYPFIF